jgi:hypothetical protein
MTQALRSGSLVKNEVRDDSCIIMHRSYRQPASLAKPTDKPGVKQPCVPRASRRASPWHHARCGEVPFFHQVSIGDAYPIRPLRTRRPVGRSGRNGPRSAITENPERLQLKGQTRPGMRSSVPAAESTQKRHSMDAGRGGRKPHPCVRGGGGNAIVAGLCDWLRMPLLSAISGR